MVSYDKQFIKKKEEKKLPIKVEVNVKKHFLTTGIIV